LRAGTEWLETDGLGGFASAPVSGPRTRRYHALLLAATRPPTGRLVLVNGFSGLIEGQASTDEDLPARLEVVDARDGRTLLADGGDLAVVDDGSHLARPAAGYVVYQLGKTGEARPHEPLSITLHHEDYTDSYQVTLQTDADGRVELGPLPGITRLRVHSGGAGTAGPLRLAGGWGLGGDLPLRAQRGSGR